MRQFPHLAQWLQYLFAAALTWSLVGLYFLNRGTSPGPSPDKAGFSTGLEFCRRELDRQRAHYSRVLLWSFGPVILALGALMTTLAIAAAGEFLQKAMPILVVATLWIASYFVIWMRRRRELQRECDEMGEVDKESSRG